MLRYPRPAGLTLLARSLQKAESSDDRNRLKMDVLKLVVGNYVNNGFTFLGKPTNVNDLAFFLQVSPNRVMREISRYSKTLASIASPEKTQETLQAMVGLLLQNALTDRGKIQKQADMLVAAQGGSYKAFVSKEANTALRNLMDSNKPLVELAKLLQGPGNTFIQNNVNSGEQEGDDIEGAITIDSAVALINEKQPGSLLESAEEKKLLFEAELGDEDLPQVVATKQRGFELQGQFATNDKPKIPKKRVKHIDRNELDGEIIEGVEDASFEEMND